MVGPLVLLQILHYKRLNRLGADSIRESGAKGTKQCTQERSYSDDASTSHVKVKQEQNEYNKIESVCRVCLKDGNISIFGNETTEDMSVALNTFGGIEVRADDFYPKYLCEPCHMLLQSAIIFRETAQRSDQLLKRPTQDTALEHDDASYTNHTDDEKPLETVVRNIKVRKAKQPEVHHCKKCDVEFKTYKDYNLHMLSEEHETMKYQCPKCHNMYAAKYLKRHMALHEMNAAYMCDICGKKFIVQGQFTRHRLTHFYHLPFKCSLCPYKGRFSESLKLHMRSHTGEKPFQCTQCPARFVTKSNLNKHMLVHKGKHDFKCDMCGRGFYTKRSLDQHFKVDHTGIKEHLCNICNKAFGYRKQMMKHQLKVHKREKLRSGRTPLYLQVQSKQLQEHKGN